MTDSETKSIRHMPDALSFTDLETYRVTTVNLQNCLYLVEGSDTITFHFLNGDKLTIPHRMRLSLEQRLMRRLKGKDKPH